mgnify:CR=1 FL=1
MPWFDSTLFVITADHTALSEVPFYHTSVGMYSIPVLYYRHNPSLKNISSVTTQQTDILPSVLHYLNYDEPFVAFGTSVFDSTSSHFAVNFQNDIYQVIENGYALQANTSETTGLYSYRTDSLLSRNLAGINHEAQKELEKKLHAFIQQYNEAMIHNKLKP